MAVQLTSIRIAGYGPWTLTLGGDREHELQMLQASLYRKVQELFSKKNCLVFPNRFDELMAVTNGMGMEDHAQIRQELAGSFDLRLLISVGCAASPLDADRVAYEAAKSYTIQDGDGGVYGSACDGPGKITIMHLDVEALTSIRKTKSPYEISCMIFELYARMSGFFLGKKSLAFFMGGDNFMAVSDDNARNYAGELIEAEKKNGITLNCGIGTGRTAREAARLATESLDTIRRIRDSGEEKPAIYEMSCS